MNDATVDEIRSRIDVDKIHKAAHKAASYVTRDGYALVEFSSGDATKYRFIVGVDCADRLWLASTFGPMYEVPTTHIDPGYAESKWLDERYRNFHTGVVYAEFINELVRCAP